MNVVWFIQSKDIGVALIRAQCVVLPLHVWVIIATGLFQGTGRSLPAGILYLKGGDLTAELAATGRKYTLYETGDFFNEEFFDTKKVVYIPRN